MKLASVHQFLLALLMVCLSGCGCRVVDWARDVFYQGDLLPQRAKDVRACVKSVVAYDEFTTAAIFDALWLSDVVRTYYVDVCALKYGKSEEQREQNLRRQLAENEHFIMFYVLSLYDMPLKEKESIWSLFLEINGSFFAPIEIKSVELVPEYKKIFGKSYSRFKVPYLVKFNACDINNKPLITDETNHITLHFRSNEKEVMLHWATVN